MSVYSYSRLKLYDDCPASYYYKYILELPEESGEPLIIGKTVHLAIEKYLKQLREGVKVNIKACIREAIKEFNANSVKDTVLKIGLSPAIDSNTFLYNKSEIEHGFHIPLDDNEEFILQGAIDYFEYGLPDDSAYLLDWKTNHIRYSANNLQMGIYAWYLSQQYGVDTVYASMIFLRYSQSACTEKAVFTKIEMEKARSWAYNIAKEIEANLLELQLFSGNPDEIFPAKPCANCQHCSYAFQCVKGLVLIPVQVNNRYQATAMAEDILRMDAASTAMKKELKKWVKASNSPIAINGGEYCFTSTVSWDLTPDGIKALCHDLAEKNFDYWQYLTIGATQIKKLNLTDSELLKYGTKKTSETFRFIKSHEIKTLGDVEPFKEKLSTVGQRTPLPSNVA